MMVFPGPHSTVEEKHWAWEEALRMARNERVIVQAKSIYKSEATVDDEHWVWDSALALAEQEVPHAPYVQPSQYDEDCAAAPGFNNYGSPGKVPEYLKEGAVEYGGRMHHGRNF